MEELCDGSAAFFCYTTPFSMVFYTLILFFLQLGFLNASLALWISSIHILFFSRFSFFRLIELLLFSFLMEIFLNTLGALFLKGRAIQKDSQSFYFMMRTV